MTVTTSDWLGRVLAAGRYRVTAKLGEGGMGFVYRAWDAHLGADVVIKAPRAAMMDDPEFAPRFAQEFRSLVRLSHPHVVKVLDVGQHEGLPFAVMQFLSGGSLEDQRPTADDGRRLPLAPATLAEWLPKVAEALDFVHRQGYVHRDVKPANILFDAHGNVYLTDFGVTKAVAASGETARAKSLTGTGMVLGTPHYMAPELIMGRPFDGRVDQYALAVTVHELMSGRPPIDGATSAAVLVNQTVQSPPPLDSLVGSTPRALTGAVLRALAKDPNRRFASCAEFAAAALGARGPAAVPFVGRVAPAPPARSPNAAPVSTAPMSETLPTAQVATGAQSVVSVASADEGVAIQPMNSIRARWRRQTSARRAAMLAAPLVLGTMLVVVAFGFRGSAPPPRLPEDTTDTLADDSKTLSERIKASNASANELDQQLQVTSAPVLAAANYESRADLQRQLDEAGQRRREESRQKLTTLDDSVKTIRADLHALLDQFPSPDDSRVDSATEPNGSSRQARFDELRKAGEEQDSALAALETRLREIQARFDRLTFEDGAAVKDLAALEEIEASIGPSARRSFAAYSLELAKKIARRERLEALRELNLTFRAHCALVRSGDAWAVDEVLATQLSSDHFQSKPILIELCRAALASSDKRAAKAAFVSVCDESALLAALQDELSEAIERQPELCGSGAPLVVHVVRQAVEEAYPLVETVLGREPDMALDVLSPQDLAACLDVAPPLGIALAKHVTRAGTSKQLEWALRVFQSEDGFSTDDLFECLDARHRDGAKLTRVLTLLLSADDDKSLTVAEELLEQKERIDFDQLDPNQISRAALDRKPVKQRVCASLWASNPHARAWVLDVAFGPNFSARLAGVQRAHQAMRSLLDIVRRTEIPSKSSRYFTDLEESLRELPGAWMCKQESWQRDAKELATAVKRKDDRLLSDTQARSLSDFLDSTVDEAKLCGELRDLISKGAEFERNHTDKVSRDDRIRWLKGANEFRAERDRCCARAKEVDALASGLPAIDDDPRFGSQQRPSAPLGQEN